MALDPEIKLLLQWRKEFLIAKAKELNLESTGTKLELAIRIAKSQEEKASRLWRSISGS